MGEEKRRLLALRATNCICGSGKSAGKCCLKGDYSSKAPASLELGLTRESKAVEKCYMKELRACEGGLSGEHLISEAVVRLLAGEGEFRIAGTPWLAEGEWKAIGPKSLTANCLCERHNGRLHRLDDAAVFFFRSLKVAFEGDVKSADYLVSGHDIERWLLKSLKALAISGNLAARHQRLAGEFASDIRLLDMLGDVKSWPQGAGLYCVMGAGDLTHNHNHFQIAPLTNSAGEISGLWTSMVGLSFVLLLEPALLPGIPELARATFRPGKIIIRHPSSIQKVILSWDDGTRHREEVTLSFVGEVQTQPEISGS